ncbi:MAG: mandelate racemase/muconate lactonizing enzyme family protein [Promethearchaeota archaeon]
MDQTEKMKITEVEIYKINIDYTEPCNIALGNYDKAESVAIKIKTDSDIYGTGEASSDPYILGTCQGTDFEVAKYYARHLIGKNPLEVETRMQEINHALIHNASIRGTFDMALYDILGKTLDQPIYRLLGGTKRILHTDLTVGMQDTVQETVDHAVKIIEQGFESVKLKVGRPGLEDIQHISAVRKAVGEDMEIKIDSNQGWDVAQATVILKRIEPLNILFSEQPLPVWDFVGMRQLRLGTSIPICADESLFDHHDALRLITTKACDYFNIKLMKSGGISTALKINNIAESAGIKCMIGCFDETRLGLTAAAHFTSAFPNVEFVDLDSALILKTDPTIGGIRYQIEKNGTIILPDGPGLGAEFNDDFLKSCENITIS